jgi:formylglycine-generating enzyme required for sulfatase activity
VEEVIDLGNGVKLELILIPPGSYLMGSPKSEIERADDEMQHPVISTRPFYLGKYPVAQQQYEQVMGSHQSYFQEGGVVANRVSGLDTTLFPIKIAERRTFTLTHLRSRLTPLRHSDYNTLP